MYPYKVYINIYFENINLFYIVCDIYGFNFKCTYHTIYYSKVISNCLLRHSYSCIIWSGSIPYKTFLSNSCTKAGLLKSTGLQLLVSLMNV